MEMFQSRFISNVLQYTRLRTDSYHTTCHCWAGQNGEKWGIPFSELYLVKATVFTEAPKLAVQIDDAGLLPDHLDSEFVVLFLQLSDLLPIFVLLDQALGILCLCLVTGMEGLQKERQLIRLVVTHAGCLKQAHWGRGLALSLKNMAPSGRPTIPSPPTPCDSMYLVSFLLHFFQLYHHRIHPMFVHFAVFPQS